MIVNMNNFAVFILTHGRPNNVITRDTLKRCGYTGKIYYIVDNEDNTVDNYISNFGEEHVRVFDKKKLADSVDEGNNFDERRTITHARNASFQIARDVGVKYFIELDDDYTSFSYKLDVEGTSGINKAINNLDVIFASLLEFFINTSCKSVAFAQGGDFIGGINNGKKAYRFSKRKCMNSFICSVDNEFQFIGGMNEDVNTYTTLGSRGNLFFTIPFVCLMQKATQSQEGGITDMYLLYGTYCKSFTTVMMMPSSVKVSIMQSRSNPRLHHSISWKNTAPMIVSEHYKK